MGILTDAVNRFQRWDVAFRVELVKLAAENLLEATSKAGLGVDAAIVATIDTEDFWFQNPAMSQFHHLAYECKEEFGYPITVKVE
jgi:hypothetical protein